MGYYAVEQFTAEEIELLRRYFTNLDQPVFALVNLPEVVKGALFARYSRSTKSLRRLFLDEFAGELDTDGDATVDATVGVARAEQLYSKVFDEYGDDSVAQLGGVHIACEQASNVLTKLLERGRLMSYLEQSTRYIPYDNRIDGRFRYHRDPELLASPLGMRFVGDMDRLFDGYSGLVATAQEHLRATTPKQQGDSDLVHRSAIRAKAFDVARGLLPAGAVSNVGIYGTGQGYEQLLLRLRAHPLPEARDYAALMLTELRKVVPSFLSRVDRPDRGGAWSDYLSSTREETAALGARLFASVPPDASMEPSAAPVVRLVDFDPDGEDKLVAAMLYEVLDLPEHRIVARVSEMSADEKADVVRAYVGDRTNRRHKPGRAFERLTYRFDVISDYGAFRDLQRHRLLTIEWQHLSPAHGYTMPSTVAEIGPDAVEAYAQAAERSAELYDSVVSSFPEQAAYGVCLAYRIRYVMQMNAREAMHVIELRSSPQGHPEYRQVAQQMHRLIAEEAGHRMVADAMSFVDHSTPALERLDALRRAEERRIMAAPSSGPGPVGAPRS
jgi:thymidylate synthase ThyX